MGSAVEPEIAALAGVAASSLVAHGVQEFATWAKGRVVALFSRRTSEEEPDVEVELEQARNRVRDAREAGDEDTVAAIADDWAGRLQDLLAEHPDAVPAVREIVGEALVTGTAEGAASTLLHYVNNTALFRAMDRHWCACREAGAVTAMFLSGVPGVGKRRSALQWIHSHRDVLAGEILRADLGVVDGRIADPAAIWERWLDELGVPLPERPAGVPAMARLIRRRLQDRPAVFLLENVTTARQVRDLLSDQPYGVVLMTGQEAPHGLHSVVDHLPVPVPLLPDEHALELLVRVSRTAEDPARLMPIVRHLGGLPLALRLVAGHLKSPVPGVLEDVIARLAERGTRQELLNVGDMNPLPEALDLTYRRMDLRTAQLYRRLGLLMRTDFQLDTVYALVPDWSGSEVRTALNALISRHVVEQVSLDTYRLPVLVHDHASIVAERDESDTERGAVSRRIAHHVLRVAEWDEQILSPRWLYDPMNVRPAGERPTEAEEAAALHNMTRRQANIFAAVRLCAEAGLHSEAWRLSQATWTFCLRTGSHTQWIESRRTGLASARETGDMMAVARMSYELGFAHLDRWNVEEGDPGLAREYLDEALNLVDPGRPDRTEAEWRTRSSVLEALGLLERKLRRPEHAIDLFARARDALAGIDHPRGVGLLTLHLGGTYTALRRHADAERELQQAKRVFEELATGPDRFNIAKTQLRLAEDRHACGRLGEAVEALDAAVDGMRAAASAYYTAEALLLRGDIRLELGEREGAVDDWTSALAHFEEARSGRVDEARRRLGGAGGESA